MAVYDVNAAMRPTNVLGMYQQGVQFGNQQRALREQREQQNMLRELAPKIVAGDPSAYSQAVAIDPASASQYEAAGQNQGRKLQGFVNYLDPMIAQAKQTGDYTRVNAALREGAGLIQAVTGKPAPMEWQPGVMDAGWEQLKVKVAMQGPQAATAEPAGFREAHMKAVAAGFQPGSPEYENVMRVASGVAPKDRGAVFGTYTDPQGRVRPQQTNNVTGQLEVFFSEYGQWIPLGGGQMPPQQTPMPQSQPAPDYMAAPEGPLDASSAQKLVADIEAAQGAPLDPQVRAQIIADVQRNGGRVDTGSFVPATPVAAPQQMQPSGPAGAPSGGIFEAPRTPEQQAALDAAAKERATRSVGLEFAPAEAEAAATKARLEAEAKAAGERASQAPKRIKQYEQALVAAGNVEQSIKNSLNLIGPTTTGFIGARLRNTEGSGAFNLAQEIETIKANLGFDRLQEMRTNSPTGGALGAIAVQELVALQSTVANLNPDQGEEQIRRNIVRIQDHYSKWRQAVESALADERSAGQPAASSENDIDALIQEFSQ